MQKPFARLFAKFERTGSVDDNRVGNVGPRKTVVTPENVAKVSGIVQQNPRNTQEEYQGIMQYGAQPHLTAKEFRFLDEYFMNRVIALHYPKFTGTGMDWPPYSPI
ncbi:hypothetical protein AVEN_268274-1 [Araneus ventricosus]|uniref:DUF4817 domain-containing protein n=1 Tax=Araneus ventricosus TaxID=182803 RepID=A0A4Y2C1I2_ARAVE|nr:hypothetical protein AVEN_268274-1 [Araneus ventricosus]